MNGFVTILLFVFALVGILVVLTRVFGQNLSSNSGSDTKTLNVTRKARFFTKSELKYYGFLQESLAGQFLIFPKVRLSDVLEAQGENKLSHYNRIRAMHFDFLILSKDFNPVLAVELDGASHESQRQQKYDATKNEACRVAGLPLERIRLGAGIETVLTRLGQI